MNERTNSLGHPIGAPLTGWTAPAPPRRTGMAGRRCRLEPLDPSTHAESLFAANAADTAGGMWTYLGYGPFESLDAYRAWAEAVAASDDPLFFAVRAPGHGPALGVASYLRLTPAHGVLEIGHIAFSPALQGTTAATEALALILRRAFDELGYRRCEWKCDALNAPSRRAAERLGFAFEGVFRRHMVVKGRNRDTAWYALTDADWPRVRAALDRWLDPENFDAEGRQRRRLAAIRATVGA